ncbi:MFS transporter [Pseudonocardia sp. GCM10023141]|uniref:MFS transporter n=1 Tax=Pseudonocardia sp. GCM10023141 TaxID=3252653 RepID=UPI003605B79A
MAVPAAPGIERPMRSRWFALAVLCGGLLMIILDGTIVSTALPTIQSDLGFSPEGLAWTVNAYLVPLGGLLLLAGRLGDLLGRRRMLVAGLSLFVVASLLCGLAVGPEMLVAARFVQGVAAAMASAVVLGMIVELFPEPAERGRAMGAYAFVGAAGASIGTLLGGVLTDAVGWPWIFFVNVPIGIVVVVLALRTLPADGPRTGSGHADVLGGVLVTAGLAALVFTIIAPSGPLVRVIAGVVAGTLLVAFVLRQRRPSRPRTAPGAGAEPLVDLRVFRSRAVSGGNVAQLLVVAAMMGFQFTVALYLQHSLGYTPTQAGLALLPVPVVIAVVSLTAAGRLITRFGARAVLVVGESVLVVGLALLTVTVGGDYAVSILPAMVLLGLGAGVVIPAVNTVIMSDATPQNAGLASGLANTSQQVGAAIGIAVLAALAAARTDGLVTGGVPTAAALASGYQLAFAISAVLAALATVVTLVVLRR